MMAYLVYVLAVSGMWFLLWALAPVIASALAMLFIGALIVPGIFVEVREIRWLLERVREDR